MEKVFALGADGIYHDESSYSVTPYTFLPPGAAAERWDNATCLFNGTLHATQRVSAIPLVRLRHKIEYFKLATSRGAQVIANEPPVTRTFSSLRPPLSVHFSETNKQEYSVLFR